MKIRRPMVYGTCAVMVVVAGTHLPISTPGWYLLLSLAFAVALVAAALYWNMREPVPAANRFDHLFAAAVAMLIGCCLVQAYHYPLVVSPDYTPEWWQNVYLAGAGFILGFPMFYLLPDFQGVPPTVRAIALYVAAILWSALWYVVVKSVLGYIRRLFSPDRSIEHSYEN